MPQLEDKGQRVPRWPAWDPFWGANLARALSLGGLGRPISDDISGLSEGLPLA